MDTRGKLYKSISSASLARLAVVSATLIVLLVVAVASAAVVWQDVNPDSSDLDATDPDAASGGRVQGLAAVPGDNQTFYAATEWGGLYKSTDGGVTWARLDGHLPVATWDVEVDPGNTNRVYATSFYDGRTNPVSGVQVSTNAGATWSNPPSAVPNAPADEGTGADNTPQVGYTCAAARRTEPSAFGIAVRPDATNNVYVGTNCGLAISTDSGVTWTFVDPTPGTPAADVWDVVVQAGGPTGQGIVDVCTGGNFADRHFRSTDGGNTWTGGSTNLPGGRCSIAASPDESYVLFVYAADNNIYESDDAGANWTNLGTPDRRRQGRVPFVVTNQRSNDGMGNNVFDLWAGDVSVFRAGCTTPAAPAMGGAPRCPVAYPGAIPMAYVVPAGWNGPFTRDGFALPPPSSARAHDDVGDIVFDSQAGNDACPVLMSSDGGVYYNTDGGADCQNPDWEQPNVTPHALWVYGMGGADRPGNAAEGLFFGAQDNGSFASTNAGSASPTWSNKNCCDVFDVVPDANRVVYTFCCGFSILLADQNMNGGAAIATNPPGCCPSFRFQDFIARVADQQYIAVTPSGAFFTTDITASPVVWTQLGVASTPAGGFCAVQASFSAGTPTFYAHTQCIPGNNGIFENPVSGQLWTYTGTAPGGTWTRVDNNDGITGGFGIFAAAPNDPNRLYASNLAPGGPQMVFSDDGGLNWDVDAELDNLMMGNGAFAYQTQRGPTPGAAFNGYAQPSLVAFHPTDPNIIVAGGRDSGVFVSTNGGQDWGLATDPLTSHTSGVPHIPRPWFAYFDDEPADEINIYIGSQGRGVWRLQVPRPALSVTKTLIDPAMGAAGVGDLVTFRIEITNTGSQPITTLPLNDIFDPRYLAFDSASVEPDAVVGGLVEWDDLTGFAPHGFNRSLDPGETFVVDVTFEAVGCPPDLTTVNKALVAGAVAEDGTALPPASDTATVDIACPEVAVEKVVSPMPECWIFGIGDAVTFEITITNTGNVAIDVLPLEDTYDTDYLAYLNATPESDDNVDDGTINWSDLTAPGAGGFGVDLVPGDSFTVVVNFEAEASTQGLHPPETEDTAAVSGAADADGHVAPDASGSAGVEIADADLFVTKDGPAEANPGGEITYTITYGNNGPDDAVHVRLQDMLPAGATYVSDTLGGAVFPGPGLVEWYLGTLVAGTSDTFELTVQIGAAVPGTVLTDEVSIESGHTIAGPVCGTPDSDPTNNSDSVDTTIVADFGDAADPPYATLLASAGPYHGDYSHEWLGADVDGETDAQFPDNFDDGIGIEPVQPPTRGKMLINISTAGEGLARYDAANRIYVRGWVDLDRDGVFDDPGERVLDWSGGPGLVGTDGEYWTLAAPNYQFVYHYIVSELTPGFTWARFRLSYGAPVGPTGAAPFGEVEDYEVVLGEIDP